VENSARNLLETVGICEMNEIKLLTGCLFNITRYFIT